MAAAFQPFSFRRVIIDHVIRAMCATDRGDWAEASNAYLDAFAVAALHGTPGESTRYLQASRDAQRRAEAAIGPKPGP